MSTATLFFLSFFPTFTSLSCMAHAHNESESQASGQHSRTVYKAGLADGPNMGYTGGITLSSDNGLPMKMTMRCLWFLFWRCLRAS